MRVIAFIEPPRRDGIEKMLRHCVLRDSSIPRAPARENGGVCEPDTDWDNPPFSPEEPGALTYVDAHEFLATL